MNRYIIDYTDRCGDLNHVWVTAMNERDAIDQAKSEYWDIEDIIQVKKIK